MHQLRVRHLLFVLILMTFASPLFAWSDPPQCYVCWTVSVDNSTTVWCDHPSDGSWGWETCTVTTRRTTSGTLTTCRGSGSQCYYMDVQG